MNEIVTVAESLIPLIGECRHTTEQDRRIAAPIVQALRENGLCRMLLDTGVPPPYTPAEWLRVLRRWRVPKRQWPGSFGTIRCPVSGPASSMMLDGHGYSATPSGCSRAPHARPDRPCSLQGVPAAWPLVARVGLRTGRLCPSHEPGARRR